MRVLLLGATGTIGQATAAALLAAGHDLVCLVRPGCDAALPSGAIWQQASVTNKAALQAAMATTAPVDAVVSCLASRTGAPKDAWAIDYQAHNDVLKAAQAAGIGRFVLLSAICVQKPLLEFQKAKLSFEAELQASGLTWSIVRATAFFKSLSGQVERVKAGKPFLLFGDGKLTACKPISDADLGAFLASCLTDPARQNAILPIGGPGPAVTPLEQGEKLFAMLGKDPKFTRVPVRMMDVIIAVLSGLGTVIPPLRAKADLARIGRYYATESMLLWDQVAGRYDAEATPEYGSDTLFDHYERLLRGEAETDLGDHAVF